MNHVRRDHQVFVEEVSLLSGVRDDPSDFSRQKKDELNGFVAEELLDGTLINEIEILTRPRHQIPEALPLELPHHGRAEESGMSRDEDTAVGFHDLKSAHGAVVPS